MGLKLKSLKVFPVFEESCYLNQVIAQVTVVRDDDNPPHLKYTKYDSDAEVYSYFTVNEINGNVYLTLDGVNAINKDHDDPSQDIHDLKFKIKVEDTEIGDNILIDVDVSVVRIHDEPPKILEDMVYDLYQGDAVEGKIVLDIRTVYPAYFFVADDNYKYFEFLIQDYGRLTLNNDGVDYIKSIDTDKTKSIDIKIEIKDVQNSKVIYKKYTIPIKSGKALQAVPKKAILEQIAQYLGEDLANKIQYLMDSDEIMKTKIKNFEDLLYSSDSPILQAFTGNSILNFAIGKNTTLNISGTNYSIFSNYELLNYISNNNSEFNKKILKQFLESTKKVINYNQEQYLIQDNILYTSNFKNSNQEIVSLISDHTFSNFFSAIFNQIDSRINSVISNLIDKVIKDIRTEYWNEFDMFEKDYLKFKLYDSKKIFQKIMKNVFEIWDSLKTDSWSDNKGLVSKVGDSSGLIGKVWDNLNRISDLEDLLYNSDKDKIYDKTTTKGVIGKIHEIDNRKLEDWGSSTGWDIETSDIKLKNSTIIDVSSSTTTLKGVSSVCLNAGSTQACLSSGGTFKVDNGNGTVDASVFTGTANKAKYADLAEYYEADKEYDVGTVLMIGGEKEVTKFKFNKEIDKKVPYAGIVSEKPGFILNSGKENIDNWTMIALAGRVKVKLENDLKPEKGQALYASEIEDGVAGIKPNPYFIGYVLKIEEGYALVKV